MEMQTPVTNTSVSLQNNTCYGEKGKGGTSPKPYVEIFERPSGEHVKPGYIRHITYALSIIILIP
jgi:hypothetical protein